jgi:hypothetical protein
MDSIARIDIHASLEVIPVDDLPPIIIDTPIEQGQGSAGRKASQASHQLLCKTEMVELTDLDIQEFYQVTGFHGE